MNAVTKASAPAAIRPVLMPTTFDQLVMFAEMAATSGLVPKDYQGKPGAIMIAVQMGSELGLSPMQSIQSIAVINGRPGVWGDGLIGLCRASPLCEDIIETLEGEGDARVASCVAKRRGATPVTGTFSVADAKKAGLWGKDIWARYSDRMLQNRARGFALRDAFPDVLRGLKTVEELIDTPPDHFRGVTIAAAGMPLRETPPLASQAEAKPEPRRTWRTLIDETRGMLDCCHTTEEVVAVADIPAVRKALEVAPEPIQREFSNLLADAYARTNPPEGSTEGGFDDAIPGEAMAAG